MKPIAIAAGVVLATASLAASADDRHGGYRHGGGARHHHAYRHAVPAWRSYGPGWSLGFYDPGFYAAPAYAYGYADAAPYPAYPAYPVYAAPPIVFEPAYVPPPPRPAPPRYAENVPPPRSVAPAPTTPVVPPPRRERYTLSAKELFDFDKDRLRSPQPKLDEIAEALKQDPGIRNLVITGYTDRLGSDAYNLGLSQRRADAVKDYLVRRGVEASRLHATGRGKANPVVQCHDRDRAALVRCLEPNRRVEVEAFTVERPAR